MHHDSRVILTCSSLTFSMSHWTKSSPIKQSLMVNFIQRRSFTSKVEVGFCMAFEISTMPELISSFAWRPESWGSVRTSEIKNGGIISEARSFWSIPHNRIRHTLNSLLRGVLAQQARTTKNFSVSDYGDQQALFSHSLGRNLRGRPFFGPPSQLKGSKTGWKRIRKW